MSESSRRRLHKHLVCAAGYIGMAVLQTAVITVSWGWVMAQAVGLLVVEGVLWLAMRGER